MMKTFPIDISGGVNLLDDPRRVAPNEVVRAQNIVPVNPGVYGTRPARDRLSVNSSAPSGSIPVSIRFLPWANAPVAHVTVHPTTGATNLYAARITDQPSMGILASQAFPAQSLRPWMAPFQQKLYVLPFLSSAPAAYEMSRDALTGNPVISDFNFSGTGNANVRPKLAIAYRNRFVYAHFGPGYENTLVFSDNFAPGTVGNDVLAVNARNVSLTPAGDGEEIVAIFQVALEQVTVPTQMALLVLRQASAFLLTGEPDQTTGGTSSLAINRININVGGLSPWAIASTPYGIIWPDAQDVWLFSTGSVPRPIGTKIRKALANVPAHLAYRVTAAYHDGFYRLMLYGEGQGPDDFSALQDQWWLDLRHGAPRSPEEAHWWGPQQFVSEIRQDGSPGNTVTLETGSRVFLPETRPLAAQQLYGMELGRFGGPCATAVQYGIANVRDSSSQVPAEQPVSEIIGTEIAIDLITREFDFDDPRNPGLIAPLEKSSDGMDFALWNSETARLQVDVIANGGEQTVSANIDQTDAGFKSGVTQLDGGTMFRKPQGQSANPQPRPVATTFQYRIRNRTGYLVNDSNDTLTILYSPDGIVPAEIKRVTVPHGLYADISAWGFALEAALQAELGSVWAFGYDVATAFFSITLVSVGPVFSVQLTGTDYSYATADEATENRRILTLMGADTSVDLVGVTDITGVDPVYQKLGAIWEFSGFSATVEVFPRRP